MSLRSEDQMNHPEHHEHEFTPLAELILNGLAEQYEPEDLLMMAETCVDLTGPFDVEELATFIRRASGHPNPEAP